MKIRVIIGLYIIIVLLITGCTTGNSFRSCHERCMEIERYKIDPTCERTFSFDNNVIEDCMVTQKQMKEYGEYCLNKCIGVKENDNTN